jgi:protocatechuate 3,4-dioxygenase alpha subunit
MAHETPTQTIGPFFKVMLDWPDGPYAVPDGTPGGVWLRGLITDGAGQPVPDAVIEIWQAGEQPVFGRALTDAAGEYAIHTVKPGPLDAQAPHIAMSVFARGLIDRLVTRVYFADEPDANATDPVLSGIDDPGARATLVAQPASDGYRFDIHLQGDDETVFFLI